MQSVNDTEGSVSEDAANVQPNAEPLDEGQSTREIGDELTDGTGAVEEEPAKRVSRQDPDPEDWEIMRRMVTLDKILTSPGRLAVLAALWRAGDLDYIYLQNLAGASQGNLATHCRKLEAAGFVESRKMFVHRRSNTRLFITEAGREAISGYVQQMRSLTERLQSWQPAIDDYREFYETGENDTDPVSDEDTEG